jgi:hypothetical protein
MTAGQKFNIFTLEELANIERILKMVPDNPHPIKGVYNHGFTERDPVYSAMKKFVVNRINEHFDGMIGSLQTGMQLISTWPLAPHNDYHYTGSPDPELAQTWLIPLYVKYQDGAEHKPNYSIVFDQTWTGQGAMEEYIATNPEKPKTNALDIWDDHMARWPQEYAEYLSVQFMGEWQMGSAMYWNQYNIHSSDDFPAKQIIEKSALVLFTNRG